MEVPLEQAVGEVEKTLAGSAGEQSGGGGQPLAGVLRRERRLLLRQAVDRLPEQRRKCITLWAYHGLKYEQIAAVLGLSLGTVKAHLAQARKQLETLTREEGS